MKKRRNFIEENSLFFLILHIITKFQQDWQTFKHSNLPKPPIWGVSNTPKTLIFSQRCAPTQGSNCTIKPKMAKFEHF